MIFTRALEYLEKKLKSNAYSVIVRVRVVMKRTVVDIGKIGRNLNTSLTEHKRATRNGDANNHIAVHHQLTNHNIDWDSAQCLTHNTNYFQRLTLKSWYTNLEQTPLNRCQQLPDSGERFSPISTFFSLVSSRAFRDASHSRFRRGDPNQCLPNFLKMLLLSLPQIYTRVFHL